MDTRNPVLSRYTPPSNGGAGFAYNEGASAYASAGTQVPAGDLYAEPIQPLPGTRAGFGASVTLNDVIMKTGLCLAIVVVTAVVGYTTSTTMPFLWMIGMVGGLILGLVNSFKKQVSPALVLAYAAFQGLFLGGISYFYNTMALANGYEGLVSQAVIGTLVAFGVMLFLYQSQLVKVNGTFAKVMMVALISYAVIGLISFISAIFGVGGGWGFYGVGGLGIALCMIGVALASFTLMLDFESIKQAVAYGLPERESWRLAFGLMVTLIWLYMEILRFLAILASNRD